jgi:hypothetical protein
MRGASTEGAQYLAANTSNVEAAFSGGYTAFIPTPTGFTMTVDDLNYNRSGDTYIYIAIRRGPMAVPEDATDVFAIDNSTRTSDGSSPRHRSDFPVDMAFYKEKTGGDSYISDRLRQTWLTANSTSSEFSSVAFDFQNGWIDSSTVVSNNVSWLWKRAPNYFDVVAYTGNGTAGRTVSHNLGVAPEMMWVKKRSSADNWRVYHSGIGIDYTLGLDSSSARSYDPAIWNGTSPTDTNFTVGSDSSVNGSGATFIAYLFASLDGVSKVGSYTGTGATLNIDCGFSSGARFVLIKRTDSSSPWWLWDSERGIVAGNDTFFDLNSNAGETTGFDWLDPYSSGFSIPSSGNNNASGASYIFYAIA